MQERQRRCKAKTNKERPAKNQCRQKNATIHRRAQPTVSDANEKTRFPKDAARRMLLCVWLSVCLGGRQTLYHSLLSHFSLRVEEKGRSAALWKQYEKPSNHTEGVLFHSMVSYRFFIRTDGCSHSRPLDNCAMKRSYGWNSFTRRKQNVDFDVNAFEVCSPPLECMSTIRTNKKHCSIRGPFSHSDRMKEWMCMNARIIFVSVARVAISCFIIWCRNKCCLLMR